MVLVEFLKTPDRQKLCISEWNNKNNKWFVGQWRIRAAVFYIYYIYYMELVNFLRQLLTVVFNQTIRTRCLIWAVKHKVTTGSTQHTCRWLINAVGIKIDQMFLLRVSSEGGSESAAERHILTHHEGNTRWETDRGSAVVQLRGW